MNVIIVGGGIIGLSIAYKLIKLGINITIFDKDRVGRSASWAAGGMIAPQAEGLEEGDFLNFCLESRDMFPQFIKEIESDTGLETGYWQCGILKLAFSEEEKEKIQKDVKRFKGLGLKAQWLEREDIEKDVKIGKEVLGGALYPDDAQLIIENL
ncbi:FAD-dependent oxidoreductase [Hydrogenivirga sp. 128-5-R1-1]|uniref:FAD-dependent oxidoreductase n=1 Tax=Hydrogenivirga sp. 128-5-R1-1 TaxID=392423 RepID=UPI00015F2A7C|nr:FAD-dependent oxidoreductase [Hydrogenivirga sp. 128-5-R1-1]EDP73646.1 glycine oxidase ThiO [Hydrogenivirga sp. 128-5-R1-1]